MTHRLKFLGLALCLGVLFVISRGVLNILLAPYGYLIASVFLAGALFLVAKAIFRKSIKLPVFLILLPLVATGDWLYQGWHQTRAGRESLAEYLPESVSTNARILSHEIGQWIDPVVFVQFSLPSPISADSAPGFRPLSSCGALRIPGAEKLMRLKGFTGQEKFLWSRKVETSAQGNDVYYLLLAEIPDTSEYWFFRSWKVFEKSLKSEEFFETSRITLKDGTYQERECNSGPGVVQVKHYNSLGVLRVSWEESSKRGVYNRVEYDETGRKLEGRVETTLTQRVPEGTVKHPGYYTYRDGKKHGPFQFFHPGTEKKAFEGEYSDGERSGRYQEFDVRGNATRSLVYEEGKILEK